MSINIVTVCIAGFSAVIVMLGVVINGLNEIQREVERIRKKDERKQWNF